MTYRQDFNIGHIKWTIINTGKHGAWYNLRPLHEDNDENPPLFSGSINKGMAQEIKELFLAVEMIEVNDGE